MHVIAYVPTYTAVLAWMLKRKGEIRPGALRLRTRSLFSGHAMKAQQCVHGVPLAPLGSSIATRHQAPEALSTEHGQGTKPACPLARRNLAGSPPAGLKDGMRGIVMAEKSVALHAGSRCRRHSGGCIIGPCTAQTAYSTCAAKLLASTGCLRIRGSCKAQDPHSTPCCSELLQCTPEQQIHRCTLAGLPLPLLHVVPGAAWCVKPPFMWTLTFAAACKSEHSKNRQAGHGKYLCLHPGCRQKVMHDEDCESFAHDFAPAHAGWPCRLCGHHLEAR